MNIESYHSLHFSAAPAVACWRFHFFFQMPPSSLYYYPALLSCSLISSSSSSSFHFTNSQFFKNTQLTVFVYFLFGFLKLNLEFVCCYILVNCAAPSSPVQGQMYGHHQQRRLLSARNSCIRMNSVELPDENEKSQSSASASPCPSPVIKNLSMHWFNLITFFISIGYFSLRHKKRSGCCPPICTWSSTISRAEKQMNSISSLYLEYLKKNNFLNTFDWIENAGLDTKWRWLMRVTRIGGGANVSVGSASSHQSTSPSWPPTRNRFKWHTICKSAALAAAIRSCSISSSSSNNRTVTIMPSVNQAESQTPLSNHSPMCSPNSYEIRFNSKIKKEIEWIVFIFHCT